jgi:hypothetical protein
MKSLSIVLLVCASFGVAYGQANKPSGDAEAVKQLERDWIDAQKAVNIDKLSQIIADDWSGLGPDGNKSTKAKFLSDVKTGATKLDSIEIGPMEVKVIGTVAVVQGSDTEKSSYKGKDTSGKWAWMDVFEKRDGKWRAVRSQSAMIK